MPCNDPKCPLNRQGVPHPIHELIENRPVTNPCLDGRCAMNRMGIPHDSHDIEKDPMRKNKFEKSTNKNFNNATKINELTREEVEAERQRRQRIRRENEEAEREQLRKDQEEEIERLRKAEEEYLLKRAKNSKEDSKINKLSREQIEAERQRRQRLDRERAETEQNRVHSQTVSEKPTPTKPKPKSGLFSRFSSKSNIPSANQILQSYDPYLIFGLKPDTTCQEIKLQFKELSRIYNASRGSINKSMEEKAQINAIQSRINTAYDTLRKRHCG